MKKLAWLVLLVLLLNSADEPIKLIQLTLINKSKMPIGVRLVGQSDYDFFYYLQVPKGDRDDPQEKTFTIASDYYYMQVYYIETYDPVYGFDCKPALPNELWALNNIRVVFLPCDYTSTRYGNPSGIDLNHDGTPDLPWPDLNRDGLPDIKIPNYGERTMRKYLPYPVLHPFCLIWRDPTQTLRLPPSNCGGYGVFRFIY